MSSFGRNSNWGERQPLSSSKLNRILPRERRVNDIDMSPRAGGGDPKIEYIEMAFNKMTALKESINEMITDLMEFKERCSASEMMQKEIIQE